MQRLYTKNATGVAPDGCWFAGDINSLQDAVAALTDLAQIISIGSLAIGESGLQLVRYGSGEARITGLLRTDGLLRGLGGLIAGAFTTAQRNAIASGLAPYGIIILNTDNNRYEWNAGTDAARNWQPLGSILTSGVDVLANRPAPNAVASGSAFFATDQAVDFVSNGSSWLRKGIPAGTTVEWHSNAAAPTGWVAYDGGNLPGSTGIYADLYAHLGNTLTKPDTRGRVSVGQGSHADVTAIGANDGLAVASRSPKHNSTPALSVTGAPGVGSLSLPSHTHGPGSYTTNALVVDVPGPAYEAGPYSFNSPAAVTGQSGDITSAPAINGAPSAGSLAVGGTVGPGGTRPADTGAYITVLKIAKL